MTLIERNEKYCAATKLVWELRQTAPDEYSLKWLTTAMDGVHCSYGHEICEGTVEPGFKLSGSPSSDHS